MDKKLPQLKMATGKADLLSEIGAAANTTVVDGKIVYRLEK